MDTIKDRNGMDLREAEDIKKKWQEYTELHKKDLNDPDNHDGVITHLEPDILECEVKCALGSITMNKASGDDGIPAELFQILKDDAVKVLHSICQHIWKTQQWPQDWKSSGFIPIPNKGNAKTVLTTTQLHSSHTLPKWKWEWLSYVWLFVTPVHGILQARILGWVAFPFSSGSSQPRSRTLQAHSFKLSHKGRPGILEWVAYPFSSGFSWPRNWTGVSCVADSFFTNWAVREVPC